MKYRFINLPLTQFTGNATPMASNIPENDAPEWICPMYPEVKSLRAGDCPVCGMVLEPKDFTINQTENPELADMRLRFIHTSEFF